MFRRSAADLQGAALRVHITLTANVFHVENGAVSQMDSDNQGELFLSEGEREADQAATVTTPKQTQSRQNYKSASATPDITSVQHTDVSMDESFPVIVAVDRAMHLNLKGELVREIFSFFFSIKHAVSINVCIVCLWQDALLQSAVKGHRATVSHTSLLILLNQNPQLL